MLNVEYSNQSIIDLKEISEYIAIDNPFYANKVIQDIYKSIENLTIFPFIGKNKKGGIREIVDPRYGFRIFYKVDIDSNLVGIISISKYKDSF